MRRMGLLVRCRFMHNIGIAVEGTVDVSRTGHLKLGSMISATIEAWEGGGVLNLGLSL